MGQSASKELHREGQPCRLKDTTETLHAVMMDLMHEQATEASIAERREEIEKAQREQQQVQAGMAAAFAAAAGSTAGSNTGIAAAGEEGESVADGQQQQQQQMDEDPFPPLPIPTLGIAVELRNRTTSAGGEQVETVHRVWVALTLPGVGLGDEGAREASTAVMQAAHLELLDVGYNEIGPAGAQHLCPALAASVAGRECLRFLRLSGNPIGLAGAKAVAEMVRGKAAASSSSSSSSSPASNNNSKNTNGEAAAAAAPPAVDGTPYLEELHLYNCDIDDAGVHALVNGLRAHDFIRSVDLGKNPTTRKSVLMLTELARRCRTLVSVRVDATPSANGNTGAGAAPAPLLESDFAGLDAALEANRAEEARRTEARAVLEAKARRREQQARDEAARREEEAREERDRIEARVRELEAAQRQHEDDVRRLAALEAEKAALQQARRKAQKAAESTEALDRAMTQAYQWRNKLGVSTGKAAIYRDGFSLYTRQQFLDASGTVRERMVPFERNPTRLRACWCDPPDAAVPYARKLHYHCKYENANPDLLGSATTKDGGVAASGEGKHGGTAASGSATDLPKYQGCRGTGHICSSVGFRTKALPNKTAAYFFSSQHPSFQDEHEEHEQGW